VTPILSATLQLLAKGAPVSRAQIEEMQLASANKEFTILDNTRRPAELDFRAFGGEYDRPIHRQIHPNPAMAKRVHEAISSWQRSVSQMTLYPKLSRKHVSTITARNVQDEFRETGQYLDKEVTQIDLEYIYHTTGIQIEGPCEMKQKFTAANLDPRTYFVSGGTAFQLSKYSAKLANLLADSFECCERHACTNPSRLRFDEGRFGIVYDLSVFTSNLHEHASFLHWLSQQCIGVSVTICDARHGLVKADLGEIIGKLYQIHQFPSYTTGNVFPVETASVHHTAGFLGVYGNIITAKFLHAIVVAQTIDFPNKLNVVGDDGLVETADEDTTLGSIRTLGTLRDEKVYSTRELAIHLKRPLIQVGSRCIQLPTISLPSFEYPADENEVDPRFPAILLSKKIERRSAAGSGALKCLQSLANFPIRERDREFVYSLMCLNYQYSSIPIDGNVPQISQSELGFVPRLRIDEITANPLENTISYHYSGFAYLAERGTIQARASYGASESFKGNSTDHLTYLEKLGYLDRTQNKLVYCGEPGYRLLIKEYVNPDPCVYTFVVNKDIPAIFIP